MRLELKPLQLSDVEIQTQTKALYYKGVFW